jgi:hypothetical protein
VRPNPTEIPTADDRPPLVALLRKAGEGDLLRAIAEAVVQPPMEADVRGLIGAGRRERSPERLDWRAGHRHRTLDARFGSLQLRVPKPEQGSRSPPLLELGTTSEGAGRDRPGGLERWRVDPARGRWASRTSARAVVGGRRGADAAPARAGRPRRGAARPSPPPRRPRRPAVSEAPKKAPAGRGAREARGGGLEGVEGGDRRAAGARGGGGRRRPPPARARGRRGVVPPVPRGRQGSRPAFVASRSRTVAGPAPRDGFPRHYAAGPRS